MMLPPPPPLTRNTALFLDLDGTLLELAETPGAVIVPEGLVELLGDLSRMLDGAVAIVSGRSIEQIDRLLSPWQATAAGVHGSEFRWPGQSEVERPAAASMGSIAESLRRRFAGQPKLEIEDKQLAVALHFRNAPEFAGNCDEAIRELIQGRSDLRLLRGHSVIEVLPAGASKANAIHQLMQQAPFRRRLPCFIGDDVTDEEAFPVIDEVHGLCIKVGSQPTRARHGLDGPVEVLAWLRFSLGLLRSENEEPSDS